MSMPPALNSDVESLLTQIFARLQQAIPFEYGGVALRAEDRQNYILHLVVPYVQSILVGDGIVRHVTRTRQPAWETKSPPAAIPLPAEAPHYAVLVVPLEAHERLVGVLVLGHQPDTYTAEHLAQLERLADQIALAVYASTTPQHSVRQTVEMQLHQAAVLQRIAVITSATLDMDEMLVSSIHETAALLNTEAALLMTLSANGRRLEVHAPSVWGFGTRLSYPSWAIDGTGHIIHTYHTGQSYHSATTVNDPVLETLQPPSGAIRNVLTIPLNTRNRTVGVLTLLNKAGSDFTNTDHETAQIIAGQIAVSLESALLFAAERARADRLALVGQISQELSSVLDLQTLLERTVQNIHKLLGYESAALLLLDDTRQHVTVVAQATNTPDLAVPLGFTFPITQGTVGQAINSQTTQYTPDVHESSVFYAPEPFQREAAASSLSLPLRSGDLVLGALDIVSTTANDFTESDRTILQTLAAHVTTAIENARLFHKAHRQISDHRFLRDASMRFGRVFVMPNLLEAVAQITATALQTDCTAVALRTNTGQYQQTLYPGQATCPPLIMGHVTPTSDRLPAIGRALQRHLTLLIQPGNIPDDIAADVAHILPDLQLTHLLVPIIQRQTYVGLIEAVFENPTHTPDEQERSLIEALAQQAAIAAENVNLIEELEQRALELGEANRLKSDFLAKISHELRTPMNSIIGFSDGLLRGMYGSVNELAADRLERILRNGHNLLYLIDDLLDISKIEAGKMEIRVTAVSLAKTVSSVLEASAAEAEARNLQITAHLPSDLPPVKADPARLRQIVSNLVDNAIKFTQQGSITIQAGSTRHHEHIIVWCSVSDTGIGIAPEDLGIIFDEFRQADGTVTREYGGTGLGLAITGKLLTMMHGGIDVESTLGEGSTFTFHLPAVAQQQGREQE